MGPPSSRRPCSGFWANRRCAGSWPRTGGVWCETGTTGERLERSSTRLSAPWPRMGGPRMLREIELFRPDRASRAVKVLLVLAALALAAYLGQRPSLFTALALAGVGAGIILIRYPGLRLW